MDGPSVLSPPGARVGNVDVAEFLQGCLDEASAAPAPWHEAVRAIMEARPTTTNEHGEFDPALARDRGAVYRRTLCRLALAFADRPGYRTEWNPDH